MDEKVRAILGLANGRRLINLGGSYALVIPRDWVRVNGRELSAKDGRAGIWVAVEMQGPKIVVSALNMEMVAGLLEANSVSLH